MLVSLILGSSVNDFGIEPFSSVPNSRSIGQVPSPGVKGTTQFFKRLWDPETCYSTLLSQQADRLGEVGCHHSTAGSMSHAVPVFLWLYSIKTWPGGGLFCFLSHSLVSLSPPLDHCFLPRTTKYALCIFLSPAKRRFENE